MTNLFDLTGHTAVVTGGSRGIGLMIAHGLLSAGARVILSSRKADACEEAVRELSGLGEVSAVPADLSKEDECVRLAEEVGNRADGIHILVNNAGANWHATIEDFPAAGWDKILDLNLKSPFYLTRAFLPQLEKTASAEDPARVINIGSIDGIRVPSYPTYSYSASKAGLHQLTRTLAASLGPRHVTVNAIAPGPFQSQMMAVVLDQQGEAIAATAPLGRIGARDDMAGAAIYFASRAASWVTGTILPVDGGIALLGAVLPEEVEG